MKKLFLVLMVAFVSVFQLAAADEEGNWFDGKLPAKLLRSNKRTVDTATALKGKMVALYFSASWCPPCRAFTPQLVKFYRKVAKKSNLELVFVSSDKKDADMMNYMKKYGMPWLAIPFNDQARAKLKSEFKVNGIPALIILDSTGKVISPAARWDVVMLGTKAVDAWKSADYKPKTYKDYQEENGSKKDKTSRNKKSRKSKKSKKSGK